MSEPNDKLKRFQVKQFGNDYRVVDMNDNTLMTKPCPQDVAESICEDFNSADEFNEEVIQPAKKARLN